MLDTIGQWGQKQPAVWRPLNYTSDKGIYDYGYKIGEGKKGKISTRLRDSLQNGLEGYLNKVHK